MNTNPIIGVHMDISWYIYGLVRISNQSINLNIYHDTNTKPY